MNRRTLLLVVAALTFGSCETGTDVVDQILGRYEFRAVDFVPVPYFTDVGGERIEVTGGYLNFDVDGTYSSVSTSRSVAVGSSPDTLSTVGTWTQTGEQLRMRSASGVILEGF